MRADTALIAARVDQMQALTDLARERLVTADAAMCHQVLRLLDVKVAVPSIGPASRWRFR